MNGRGYGVRNGRGYGVNESPTQFGWNSGIYSKILKIGQDSGFWLKFRVFWSKL